MDIAEQIKHIRFQKHQEYLDYCRCIEEKKLFDNKVERLIKLHNKYKDIFDPKKIAIKKIQNFIRKNYFEPQCINELEMRSIPPIYRLRITITNHHVNEYSEES